MEESHLNKNTAYKSAAWQNLMQKEVKQKRLPRNVEY